MHATPAPRLAGALGEPLDLDRVEPAPAPVRGRLPAKQPPADVGVEGLGLHPQPPGRLHRAEQVSGRSGGLVHGLPLRIVDQLINVDDKPGIGQPGGSRTSFFVESPMAAVHFLDVTNRDGVQTARINLSKFGKTMVNLYLGKLGVSQSELGFPFLFHEVPYVRANLALAKAGAFGDLKLSGWARAVVADVERSVPLGLEHMNLSISTSEQMIRHKFRGRLDRASVLEEMTAAARAAKRAGVATLGVNAEDASRTDDGYLLEFAQAAREAGADRVRYCDTIGGDSPARIRERFANLAASAGIALETHCHNDLGMAVANSVAGALGTPLPIGQPGVGRNAFAHESGIHADGALKDRHNYELYDDETLGPFPHDHAQREGRVVLTGEYGGRAGFRHVMDALGVEVGGGDEDLVFKLVQLTSAASGRPLTDDELRLLAAHPREL